MADSLSHSKQERIVVLDFLGAGGMEPVGQELAAEFRTALSKSARGFRVDDRSQLLEVLRENDLVPGNIRDSQAASWLLRQTGADTSILGNISAGIGGLRLSVTAHRVADSDSIVSFETSVPVTQDLKALEESEEDGFTSFARGGQNGYSSPQCIYCPRPNYSAEALKSRVEGDVVLQMTIGEEGAARDIRVKIPMPYGLTQQAIDAVKEWRLKPATGPDGKPAAVREEVDVAFEAW
ncbi:MAG: TonB family protein [Candidatus Acidiferrales bacterium]